MKPLVPLITLLATVHSSLASQPQEPLNDQHENAPSGRQHRIAIIGGGAAGSSAAFHLSRFAAEQKLTVPLEITVFESEARVGGRALTVNAFNNASEPVELAGAIFVSVNEILVNATREFGLSTEQRGYEPTGTKHDLGVWDGSSFVFTTGADTDASTDDNGAGKLGNKWAGWWDIAKLLWRYGISPVRLQSVRKDYIGRFLRMYHELFPFESLSEAVQEADLIDVANTVGADLLRDAGISDKFSREIIQASTRVNYAENLGTIHGLGTMVSMSTDGAMSVMGGNWQIFDNMVRASGATLRLNTTVTSIELQATGEKPVTFKSTHHDSNTSHSATFDTIILSHPWHHTPNPPAFQPSLLTPPEKIPYVTQNVMLFGTPQRPSPSFFNLATPEDVPDSVLTTTPGNFDLADAIGSDALGPHNKFWSLSTLRTVTVHNATTNTDEKMYLYKTFSPEPLEPTYLARLFDLPTPAPDATVQDLFPWVHHRVFQAYPYLFPRTSFENFTLHFNTAKNIDPAESPGEGLGQVSEEDARIWYTSPIEAFISTMETSALSGRNVAGLIVRDLKRKEDVSAREEVREEIKSEI